MLLTRDPPTYSYVYVSGIHTKSTLAQCTSISSLSYILSLYDMSRCTTDIMFYIGTYDAKCTN